MTHLWLAPGREKEKNVSVNKHEHVAHFRSDDILVPVLLCSGHGSLYLLHMCHIFIPRVTKYVSDVWLPGTVYTTQLLIFCEGTSIQKENKTNDPRDEVWMYTILCSWSHGWPRALCKQTKISDDPHDLEPMTAWNFPQRDCKSKQRLTSSCSQPAWVLGLTPCFRNRMLQ